MGGGADGNEGCCASGVSGSSAPSSSQESGISLVLESMESLFIVESMGGIFAGLVFGFPCWFCGTGGEY